MVHCCVGTAGGEAQQADIRQLLKELELKKAKLNELKGESRKTEGSIAKIRDDDTDAQRLTPDDCVQENAYIQVGCQCNGFLQQRKLLMAALHAAMMRCPCLSAMLPGKLMQDVLAGAAHAVA